MKYIIKNNLLLSIFLYAHFCLAQGALPIHRYRINLVLDIAPLASSFGYSLRKLKKNYTGFSMRVRRGTDNAEGDIRFDALGIVSVNSNVTVTAVGTSGLSLGQVLSLNTFKGAQSLFVTTWYDQGVTAYHAVQTVNANQPELQLNVAGTGNTKPALFFNGNFFLIINKPIETLMTNGFQASLLLATKPTSNYNQFSFWYRSISDWRWSIHLNWTDGNFYFDSGEVCCAGNRAFFNSPNINLWKQYSIVRGIAYKTVRVNSNPTALNNSGAASTPQTGGNFQIGSTMNNPDNRFKGYFSEFLMFSTDFPTSTLLLLETNQISYWNL